MLLFSSHFLLLQNRQTAAEAAAAENTLCVNLSCCQVSFNFDDCIFINDASFLHAVDANVIDFDSICAQRVNE